MSNRFRFETASARKQEEIIWCRFYDCILCHSRFGFARKIKHNRKYEGLMFRIESGDATLQRHIEEVPANARYTSVQVEHQLLTLCKEILREDIVQAVNDFCGFSVLADESSDISGKEQLSLGVRFLDTTKPDNLVREEFVGFAVLNELDAESVANATVQQLENFRLNLDRTLGQGYDGCVDVSLTL